MRYDSLDVMRALAIALMIPCHFILFLSPPEGSQETLYTLGNDVLGGLAAPLFLFLVGICARNTDPARLVKRGAVVFALGLLFQIPIEGAPYEWDVLTFIGFALVVLAAVRRAPTWLVAAAAAGVFAATPWLRGMTSYLQHWEPATSPRAFLHDVPALFLDPLNEYLSGSETGLRTLVQGFFVNGYFPCFPWLTFPLLGVAVGRVTFAPRGPEATPAFAILGATLASAGTALAFYAQRNGIPNFESGFVSAMSYFPPSPAWLLVQLGFCLGMLALTRPLCDRGERRGRWREVCRLFSRYSLTVYVLHYLVAYWPPRLAGLVAGHGVDYVGNWISPAAAWGLGLVAMAAFYPLLRLWDARGGAFSLEWVINAYAVTRTASGNSSSTRSMVIGSATN